MKVVLMGLEFFINNLGCEALSYSFVNELYRISLESNEKLELSTIVFADKKIAYIPGTDIPIKPIGIHYKSPSFWKRIYKEFKDSDFVFDFTMGDSFSDIYGFKRFALDALVKSVAILSGTPYILGPQTYGPYKSGFVKKWATWILKRATTVYTRDEQSLKLAEELTSRKVYLTTDVAFALPYEKQKLDNEDKISVGFNPSGLLWAGGYTGNNQFSLKMDYQKYCYSVCEKLSNNPKYQVYLIPHVGTNMNSNSNYENDSGICKVLHDKYPNMIILDGINTPMDVKGYIAAMDVFIGARMHATIGAFSSGVATIPVSYSRKFEGLYGSLGYDYVVHALTENTEEAIEKTLTYINNYEELKAQVAQSMDLVGQKQAFFRESLVSQVKEKQRKS